jgi:hypothetical protein
MSADKLALAYLRRAQEAEAALLALVLDRGSEAAWAEAERVAGLLEPQREISEPRWETVGRFLDPNG